MADRQALGRWAEELATQEAIARGWQVLDRNWRCRWGELDLVVWDGVEVIVVEVKCRRQGEGWGAAAAAIDRRKQGRLVRLAAAYLQRRATVHGLPAASVPVRFDAYLVQLDAGRSGAGPPGRGPAVARWIPGAFEARARWR